MQIDIGDFVKTHAWKIVGGVASIIGTAVGGVYWSGVANGKEIQDHSTSQEIVLMKQDISRLEGKVDTVINILGGRN